MESLNENENWTQQQKKQQQWKRKRGYKGSRDKSTGKKILF